jgi:hypothetical protein
MAMRGKTFIAAIFVIALLASVFVGLQAVEVAKANPVRLTWVPTSPDTSLPQVTVESPTQNTSYSSSEVTLNFTIIMPESWFRNDPTGQAPIGYYCNGKIISTQITIDGKQLQNISINNDTYLPYSSNFPLGKNLTLTANLSLSEGKHILIVHLVGESYYSPSGNLTIEHYPVSSDSTPITVYVDSSAPASNPTLATALPYQAINIKPDGSVEPSTSLLARNGTKYTFTGDIFGTIWVQTNNIIINGAGHTLQGSGIDTGQNTDIGILLGGPDLSHRECAQVLVQNLRIYNIPRGIFSVGGSNNSFIGNYFEKSGMEIQGNANQTGDLIKHNTFINATIAFDYDPNGTDIITENNLVNCEIGIWLSTPPIVDRNYWSEYFSKYPNALEIQGTGIGNTPYVYSTIQNGTQTIPCQDNNPLLKLQSIASLTFPSPQHQGELVTFSASQHFAIPSLNSTIIFAAGGSYLEVSFNWTFWHFSSLRIGNSESAIENFDISAQDCYVTVQSYTKEFGTDNFLSRSTLNCTVAGGGNQTFYYTAETGGFWYAFVDGVEGGYSTALTGSDYSITVTGSKPSGSNVTIVNAVPPAPKPPPTTTPPPSLSPTQQPKEEPTPPVHSLPSENYVSIIIVSGLAAIVPIFCVLVYLKKRKGLPDRLDKG